ncbi:MAG: tRNA pseudouridine(38-40) synthase TruA [Clostridia bacterium]|nr:tRNA pseudouridine(38-40) synthase TruA [Clostridia bacterium]
MVGGNRILQGYILKIAYKGTNYCGWQVQPEKPTVQATLQKAITESLGVAVCLTGCSRTDSGVHAKGFVALVTGELPDISKESLPLAINTKLPEDISVLEADYADEDFHPRYSAKGKEYIYKIRNSRIRDPFENDFEWTFPKHIDVEYANELCQELVGRHDFKAFMAAGSKITDTVREIKYFNAERNGDEVIFRVAADGFLYNMVRIMVGTVAHAAAGDKMMPIRDILASLDRANAGITAPAKGLTLNRVFY